MRNERLDALIWVLIFGGLLVFSVGLFVPDGQRVLQALLVVAGLVAAAAGAVLVAVRAHRPD
ncbi:MAG: hypothetical protein RI988_2361 [Pseudomonadota bacterium]|jgi:hypothetical protein